MIDEFIKKPKVALSITFGCALLFAYKGWGELISPPTPPFKGKGAWLNYLIHEVFGPLGHGCFLLLMSIFLGAMVIGALVKKRGFKF